MTRFRVPTAEELGARDPDTIRTIGPDPIFVRELDAIQAEQVRRDGREQTGALKMIDGARHPDLLARYQEAMKAAEARAGVVRRRPLRVKVGDFVDLRGTRCRVESVNPFTNVIRVSHAGLEGSWNIPIDGTGIVPEGECGTPVEVALRERAVAKGQRTDAGAPATRPPGLATRVSGSTPMSARHVPTRSSARGR